MSKKEEKTQMKTSKLKDKTIKVDKNMGRPFDTDQQKRFMQLLKKGKLQAIDAQSMSQLECFSFPDSTKENDTSMREKANMKSSEPGYTID